MLVGFLSSNHNVSTRTKLPRRSIDISLLHPSCAQGRRLMSWIRLVKIYCGQATNLHAIKNSFLFHSLSSGLINLVWGPLICEPSDDWWLKLCAFHLHRATGGGSATSDGHLAICDGQLLQPRGLFVCHSFGCRILWTNRWKLLRKRCWCRGRFVEICSQEWIKAE